MTTSLLEGVEFSFTTGNGDRFRCIRSKGRNKNNESNFLSRTNSGFESGPILVFDRQCWRVSLHSIEHKVDGKDFHWIQRKKSKGQIE
jgi:hypothetical protein